MAILKNVASGVDYEYNHHHCHHRHHRHHRIMIMVVVNNMFLVIITASGESPCEGVGITIAFFPHSLH
jgi:hypothetical protein